MKTAISIPDETFERAERRAALLGLSRSEFFSRAAQRYLEQLDAESLTERIDAALDLLGGDESAVGAVAAGRRRRVVIRGGIYWVDLGSPTGSRPAKRRPVLVVQSASYNASRLATVVTAVITSNTGLATMPGNVFLPTVASGLPRDSVVNVTALVTLDKVELDDPAGHATDDLMRDVEDGLRRVLGL